MKIQVLFRGFVTAFFQTAFQYELTETVSMNSTWEDNSPCICERCQWEGSVAEAIACSPSVIDLEFLEE